MNQRDQPANRPLPSGSSSGPGLSEGSLAPELIEHLAEYGQALARGEPIDAEKLLAGYPQIAEQLTAYLRALEFVHAAFAGTAAPPLSSPQEDAPTPSDGRRVLGDFLMLAERGRGGMGVVYEAEQLSLKRRVAVKVLLGAAALTPGQLQRFKNEAMAAASLDHPHIVKVHSVGCDHGVHYYAMQYVEGQSLAEVIHTLQRGQVDVEIYRRGGLPGAGAPIGAAAQAEAGVVPSTERPNRTAAVSQTAASACGPCADFGSSAGPLPAERARQSPPSVRRREHFSFAARLAVQAAEALEHAHRMGILHRDIKPSNLLLDATGHLWVTDFGLALMQAGTAVTLTGDIVGTLRYMSPEQALGRRHLLGQSTDIYSLGSTLYELLTLQPPFPEEDRHALLHLLAEHDPPSPRRINPAVPRDLETIVMKCLAKEPAARYVSAKALADDLRRFLEDEPILAQRPSLAARLGRWSRRHRSIVYSATLLLTLVFAGLIVANWRIAQERNVARQAAERERAMAAVAEQQRAVAESERGRAEANFQKAREAVDRGVRRAAEEMADQPHMEAVRRVLLEDALEFYQGFLAQKTDDAVVGHEAAMAYFQVGYIQVLLGQYQKCLAPLEQACRLLEALVASHPQEAQYRLDLARPYGQLAYATMWARRHDVAISYRRKQLAVVERLPRDFPSVREYWWRAAYAHSDVGVVLCDAGDRKAAIKEYEKAAALCEEAMAAFPDDPMDRHVVGHVHHWWGYALEGLGQLAEAETHYRTAHQLRTEALAEQPANTERKHLLEHIKTYLASLLLTIGKSQEAETFLREAIAIDEDLLQRFPHTADYRRRAGMGYALLGRFLVAANRAQEAEAALRRCVAIAVETVADRPGVETHIFFLARYHFYLGGLLDAQGRSGEAMEAFHETLKGFETILAAHPDNVDCQGDLGAFLVSCPASQFRDPPRAIRLLQQAVERQSWNALHWAALALAQNRVDDATAAIKSIETARQLTDGGESRIWLLLAMTHWRLGHYREARTWRQKAVDQIDKLHPIEEDNYRLRA